VTDREERTRQQYASDANLTARINLHRRFSTNMVSWNRWVFDQMQLSNGAHVLEIGAGTGRLWSENRDRLPAGLRLVFSDPSEGMLVSAKERLADLGNVEFRKTHADKLTDDDFTFDTVIANHMLYEVPDRNAVFSEVVRILRPEGRFYAATNGENHMHELDALIGQPEKTRDISTTRFSLENGAQQLAPYFGSVELARYENPLAVTDVSAVLAYVTSLSLDLSQRELNSIGEAVEGIIARSGAFRITPDPGMFMCGEPLRASRRNL
jgi:ubiquinone/menaquinone biosynthesis C-methylase UbiE